MARKKTREEIYLENRRHDTELSTDQIVSKHRVMAIILRRLRGKASAHDDSPERQEARKILARNGFDWRRF